MSNMSYCRFRNTLSDLRDCRDAMCRLVDGVEEPLSRDEATAAAQLAELCRDIVTEVCEAADLDYDLYIHRLKLGEAVRMINSNALENYSGEEL